MISYICKFPAGLQEYAAMIVVAEDVAVLEINENVTVDQLTEVETWAHSRIDRLNKYGTEPDGWYVHPDGGFQIYGRFVSMPPL